MYLHPLLCLQCVWRSGSCDGPCGGSRRWVTLWFPSMGSVGSGVAGEQEFAMKSVGTRTTLPRALLCPVSTRLPPPPATAPPRIEASSTSPRLGPATGTRPHTEPEECLWMLAVTWWVTARRRTTRLRAGTGTTARETVARHPRSSLCPANSSRYDWCSSANDTALKGSADAKIYLHVVWTKTCVGSVCTQPPYNRLPNFKGIVHPKMKIMSLISHPHVNPNL